MKDRKHKKIILKNGFTANQIQKAGFDGFFAPFETAEQTQALVREAKQNGLLFWGLHAPFCNVNGLWQGEVAAFRADFTACVDAASTCGIREVMVHLTYECSPPPVTEDGIRIWSDLVCYARDKGVRVTVENMEIPQHVLQILDCGGLFCYDSGHAFAYTPSTNWLARFTPTTLHLHDNYGMRANAPQSADDLHLVPFDGDIDWNTVCESLRRNGFDGDIVLEVKKNRTDRYAALSDEEYLDLCYCRACRLDALLFG